jgi:hypothetical protein
MLITSHPSENINDDVDPFIASESLKVVLLTTVYQVHGDRSGAVERSNM